MCMCRVVPGALNASLVIWGFHIGLRFLVKCYTALIKRWNCFLQSSSVVHVAKRISPLIIVRVAVYPSA